MDHRFPPLRSQQQLDAISAPRVTPLISMTFGGCLVASVLVLLATL